MNKHTAQASARWHCSTRTIQWEDKGMLPVTAHQHTSNLAVKIDLDRPCQEIEGWGGCFNELGWQALSVLPEGERLAVIKALFDDDGCRFDYCRMPIGASDYAIDYYSLNDTPGDFAMQQFSLARDRQFLIPFIRAAMTYRHQLRMWGSPWTPPAWMKTNGLYYRGELTWTPENLRAYALYFAKYVQAYRAEGINIVAVHVQNEPMHKPLFPSCWWNGWQMRDFIRDYLGPRFAEDGIDAEIWMGTINGETHFNVYGDWVVPVLSDEQASAYIAGCAFQWFGDAAVVPMRQHFPEKRMMQSETKCGNGSNDWTYAEETFQQMRWYFERDANAYMQWNMVLDETGNSTWGWKQSAMVTINRVHKYAIFNPQYYAVKHFSHFVQTGAHRLSACGTYSDYVAFRNPDGEIVIVAANTSDGDLQVSFAFGDKQVTAELPARSFNTLRIPTEA